MNRKMIVVSEDAMVWEDMALLRQLPVFGAFYDNGARVETLRTIYPTVTYPVHTSIATGCYPDRHGIVGNAAMQAGAVSAPWHWFAQDYTTPNIFAAAKKAGLSTAAVFWPVTGCDPNIDFLVDEYWSQSSDDPAADAFARSGSTPEVMDKIVRPNLHLLEGHQRQHPQADEFVNACACAMIREFQPDLLMIHPANIDGLRHKTGLFGVSVDHQLHLVDRWLGQLVEAAKAAGIYENTDFVILSDHGQINISRVVCLNNILREHNMIWTDETGKVTGWEAWINSVGTSAHVYLKDPSLRVVRDRVYTLLRDLAATGAYGIGQVFTREEIAKKERLSGDFSFVLETDGYTSFGDDWMPPVVRSFDVSDYRTGRATHGMLPDKGPQPTLLAYGPSFAAGAAVARRPIVDVTATLAKVLGITMDGIDGKPIDEIIR